MSASKLITKLINKQYPVIIVANYSGNVGKTAVTKQLLAPRMPGVEIFAIETVNSGYENQETNSGDQTRAVLTRVLSAMQSRPVIIDVGASNAETFFAELGKLKPLLSKVSAFVVPTMPEAKAITDTLSTIDEIVDTLGFPAEKVFVVMNKLPGKIKAEDAFISVVKRAKSLKFNCIEQALEFDETFLTVNSMGTTIDAIANDIDYLEALSTVGPEEIERYSEMSILQINARDLQGKMNKIFDKIGG